MPESGVSPEFSQERAMSSVEIFGREFRVPVVSRFPLPVEQVLRIKPKRDTGKQSVLRSFEGRFAIAGNMLELDGANLGRRTSKVARLMVEGGMLDETTLVELRTMCPEDDLCEDIVKNGLEKMNRLRHALADEHGVTRVIPNSHPIMPAGDGVSFKPPAVWQAVGSELDGFKHQWSIGSERPDLAMLAIASDTCAEQLCSSYDGLSADRLRHGITVLDSVGSRPEENVLR
ncbi:MAG TPA: hypothetical protein VFK11_02000 [Candidatus Saccharimonadales bacterium]|nr:hypothetical protein [Candidatus Saccharimonadales bacterium]